jgi:general secretion pathway protein N
MMVLIVALHACLSKAEAQEVVSPDVDHRAKPEPDIAQSRRVKNIVTTIPMEQLTETSARPLFSISRRPKPPPAAQPVAVAEPKIGIERPQLALLGTILGESGGIAIFLNRVTNSVIRMRQGDALSGWTLRAVQLRTAVLTKGDDSFALELQPQTLNRAASSPLTSQMTSPVPMQPIFAPPNAAQ